MDLSRQFDRALSACGFPLLQSPLAYRRIGAGAWHDAYLVTLRDGSELVIRLRKQVIYGRQERFDEQTLHEEYAPVGVYYKHANTIRPGTCPAIYTYLIRPGLICTIESDMGAAIDLAALSPSAALDYGVQLGALFRAIHALPPPIDGFGDLGWRDGRVVAQEPCDPAAIRRAEAARAQEQLARLLASELSFDRAAVRRVVEEALARPGFAVEPVALVNRDITPENMLITAHGRPALVDPVPLIDRPMRYASFFRFCYRFLLPALGDAPRYARHQFQRRAPLLSSIADGYVEGYAQGDPAIRRELDLEERLWLLDTICGYYDLLRSEISQEQQIRTGGKTMIATNMQRGLRMLEQASSTL